MYHYYIGIFAFLVADLLIPKKFRIRLDLPVF